MTIELTRAAVYEREVSASLQRVWENVHDWEHLPWLHAQAFCGIELLDSGPWGWRARVQLAPRELDRQLVIELRCEEEAPTYHTRTLEGPGAGSDTRTTLTARGDRTHVRVEFWVPRDEPAHLDALGAALAALYTGLWDQDEAMMRRRQSVLDGQLGSPAPLPSHAPVPLGPLALLEAELPMSIAVEGQHICVREHQGQLVAHATLCPHRGGPLEEAEIHEGFLVCPWHGYRFSLRDGRNPDGRPCSLPHAPRVEIAKSGETQLMFPASSEV
jgi:nitrite reductase/ring-hydroxylating ferredoxin subunit